MIFSGIGACEGAVTGKALVFRHEQAREARGAAAETPEAAMEQFYRGRRIVSEELAAMGREAEQKYGSDKAGIFEGYSEILMDDEIEELVRAAVQKGIPAATAAREALETQARELEALDNAYMGERGSDLADIGRRLAAAINGESGAFPVLTEPVILVADDLSPFETVRLDPGLILGLALDKGGYTGHVAILARSLGIPCAAALGNASALVQNNELCALDGGSGRLENNPADETLAAFKRRETERKQRLGEFASNARTQAFTCDGAHITVCANIGAPEEAVRAAAQGADGVGLFRTEFLYLDRGRLPAEDEQFAMYRKALDALEGKPLTIRTLDIGGDKAHPALGLEKEDNPFLGYRAIRLALDQSRVFKPQLRAILRAAAFGSVELMFPLVVSLDEFRRARALTEEARAELEAEGIAAGSLPLGIMVETPAAALLAREFAAEADFFSIGTNDLTQYVLAADRGNPRVAALYDPLNPAVLRLISQTCGAAAEAGIPVCLCGELASDEAALPLLIGLGLGKLSVSAAGIPRIKAAIRGLDSKKCRELARNALALSTGAEVRALLRDVPRGGG